MGGAQLSADWQPPKTVATAKAKPAAAAPKAAAASPAPEASTPTGSAAAATEASASNEWSTGQQKALEQALQRFPATMEKNERWRSIAAEVPGITKAQCVDRFKYLREQVKK